MQMPERALSRAGDSLAHLLGADRDYAANNPKVRNCRPEMTGLSNIVKSAQRACRSPFLRLASSWHHALQPSALSSLMLHCLQVPADWSVGSGYEPLMPDGKDLPKVPLKVIMQSTLIIAYQLCLVCPSPLCCAAETFRPVA